MRWLAAALIGLFATDMLFATEQFMLRYDDEKSHWMVTTGCYSATGYAWKGPSITTLKTHRKALLAFVRDHADVPASSGYWAWSMNQVEGGNRLALDLESGSVMAISEGLAIPIIRVDETGQAVVETAAHRKALVVCQCKVSNLTNCARNSRLGPLGSRPSLISR